MAIISLLSVSCATMKQISYFQDTQPDLSFERAEVKTVRFQPEDKISVLISTKDTTLDYLFNLSSTMRSIDGASSSTNTRDENAYRVNVNGDIELPVLGLVHVKGLTREEVRQEIVKRLTEQELVSDPVVVVDFADLGFSVLGEVSKPGRHSITRDQFTIIDAIASAGDLTLYSKRENITVYRTEDDKVVPYVIDMTNLNSIYNSPVYYVKQNDMIYIEPTKMKARQSSVNGNQFSSYSFWVSVVSLIISSLLLF